MKSIQDLDSKQNIELRRTHAVEQLADLYIPGLIKAVSKAVGNPTIL